MISSQGQPIQFNQLMRQLLMGGKIFTKSDKSPDDINADVDGFGCIEDAGRPNVGLIS